MRETALGRHRPKAEAGRFEKQTFNVLSHRPARLFAQAPCITGLSLGAVFDAVNALTTEIENRFPTIPRDSNHHGWLVCIGDGLSRSNDGFTEALYTYFHSPVWVFGRLYFQAPLGKQSKIICIRICSPIRVGVIE
jgi:hypothetical protein